MDVVITVPHFCVEPKDKDPRCDYGTDQFANQVFKSVRESGVKGIRIRKFVTDVPRMLCDTNRSTCRGDKSRMRKSLSNHLERLQLEHLESISSWKKPFLLFDIHSFGGGGRAFGLDVEPYIVLLVLPHDKKLGRILFDRLKANRVFTVWIEASNKNDIIWEASHRGGKTVLIEFKEETNISDPRFKRTMIAIQETVRIFAK